MSQRIELGGLQGRTAKPLFGNPEGSWARVPLRTQPGDVIVVKTAEWVVTEVETDTVGGAAYARLAAIPAVPAENRYQKLLRDGDPW